MSTKLGKCTAVNEGTWHAANMLRFPLCIYSPGNVSSSFHEENLNTFARCISTDPNILPLLAFLCVSHITLSISLFQPTCDIIYAWQTTKPFFVSSVVVIGMGEQ